MSRLAVHLSRPYFAAASKACIPIVCGIRTSSQLGLDPLVSVASVWFVQGACNETLLHHPIAQSHRLQSMEELKSLPEFFRNRFSRKRCW